MDYFLEQAINGLSLGCMYAFIALGYTMVYGIIKLINFAHSEFFMVGAILGTISLQYLPIETLPLPAGSPPVAGLIVAMLVAGFGTAALAVISEMILYKPLRGEGRLAAALASIYGLLFILFLWQPLTGISVLLSVALLFGGIWLILKFLPGWTDHLSRSRQPGGRIAALLTALGLSLALQNGAVWLFSPTPRAWPEGKDFLTWAEIRSLATQGQLAPVAATNPPVAPAATATVAVASPAASSEAAPAAASPLASGEVAPVAEASPAVADAGATVPSPAASGELVAEATTPVVAAEAVAPTAVPVPPTPVPVATPAPVKLTANLFRLEGLDRKILFYKGQSLGPAQLAKIDELSKTGEGLFIEDAFSTTWKKGMVFIALAVFGALLYVLVIHTNLGKAMRAVSYNPDAARLMGINANQVISFTFFIGAFLAGIGGVLWGVRYGKVEPYMGFLPGLKAFVAAVLGGIGSIPGAILGGILLGLVEALVAGYGFSAFRDAVAFVILIVILLVLPSGLMGGFEGEKV